jgi:hypothetical protein
VAKTRGRHLFGNTDRGDSDACKKVARPGAGLEERSRARKFSGGAGAAGHALIRRLVHDWYTGTLDPVALKELHPTQTNIGFHQ